MFTNFIWIFDIIFNGICYFLRFAGLYQYERKLTTEDLAGFVRLEYGRIGAEENITPREVIRDFIELADLLYQNPGMTVEELMQSDAFSYAKSEAVSDESDAQYAEFTI